MKYNVSSLSELVTYVSRGITPKYIDSADGVIVLNQKCIRNYSVSYHNSRMHDNKSKKVLDEKYLQQYDVLINSTGVGTAGRVAQYKEKCQQRITVDGHITIVRPDISKIDPVFLGYSLKYNQTIIEGLAEGSTGQTEINRNRLCNEVLVKYPESLKMQTSIATILAIIDDKIEKNTATNNNLLLVA